jgi:hypothetical protein
MQEKKSWLIPYEILKEYLKKAFPQNKNQKKNTER